MSRTALISATALLLATSSAYAFDIGSSLGLSAQTPVASADANASAQGSGNLLQSAKDTASSAASTARDAGIAVGTSAVSTGKSIGGAASDAGHAVYNSAKDTGQKAAAAAKAKYASATVASTSAITVKDKVALGKHFGALGATNKAVSSLFGSSSASTSTLPSNYKSKLVVGAKLDASVAGQAQPVDPSSVPGLSAQPAGTQLLLVGNSVVRVDSSTQVVLDVASL